MSTLIWVKSFDVCRCSISTVVQQNATEPGEVHGTFPAIKHQFVTFWKQKQRFYPHLQDTNPAFTGTLGGDFHSVHFESNCL